MNNFPKKQRVIPNVVLAIAAIAYVAGFLLMRCAAIPSAKESVHWPEGGKLLLSLVIPLFFVAGILLIGYVYGDAKRRGMRYVMWTLLAIFIPDGIGIILYFILRDPMPPNCPGCGARVQSTFAFCPSCSTPLRRTCTRCGQGLERGWKHCPNCGAATPTVDEALPPAGPPAANPL
jgi:Double zinc ribbon